jgi:hypothetical protein
MKKSPLDVDALNAFHENPDHWHLIFFYFGAEDPRIVIKKRHGIGWTVNFARPMAVPFIVALIAAVYGYLELMRGLEFPESGQWAGVFLLLVLIVGLCGWMANPRRHVR